MARQPRDPRAPRDRPSQRPILQGHLRPGGHPIAGQVPTGPPPDAIEEPSAQPSDEVATSEKAAVRGKATRSPAELARRRNLEGSEQGPR